MGVAIYPNTASVIKSMQSGSASGAGTITISSVNINKTVVNSFSTGSSGTVAATGTVNAANGSTSGISFSGANFGVSYYIGVAKDGNLYPGNSYSAALITGYNPPTRYIAGNANYGVGYIATFLNAENTNGANIGMNNQSISGGTTSLTAAVYGAYLTNSTTLTVTGPCQYQIIEYY